MGMTKASLDLQIQQETQRAIASLQKNMTQLNGMLQVIDGNLRQSHVVLFQDITQLRVRVNFLMGELKRTTGSTDDLEERFKEFAKEENEKIDKDIREAIAARERAQEIAKAEAALETKGPTTDAVQ